MVKKIVLVFLALLFFLPVAFAETIKLKNGNEVQGKIIERKADQIIVDLYGVQVPFYLNEIEKIDAESVSPTGQEGAVSIATQEPAVTSVLPESNPAIVSSGALEEAVKAIPQEQKPEEQPAPPVEKEITDSGSDKQVQPGPWRNQEKNEKAKKASAIFVLGIILLVTFVVIIGYIFSALCLVIIAQKTGNEPIWWAWVPIANLFLMCKIASLKYWWLFVLLAGFIPFIGTLVELGFMGFVWYKIALARGKPGWIGALVALPLVNLIVIGYLAFSE